MRFNWFHKLTLYIFFFSGELYLQSTYACTWHAVCDFCGKLYLDLNLNNDGLYLCIYVCILLRFLLNLYRTYYLRII